MISSSLHFLVLVVTLATTQIALADKGVSDQQLLTRAEAAYKAEQYSQAIASYEQLISRNRASAQLFVNLGTAYFRDGSPGRAALWYRRAELLNPDMPEVRQNLEVLKQNLGHHDFKAESWHYWILNLPTGIFRLLAWLAFWFSMLIVLLVLFSKRPNVKPPLIVLLIFTVSACVGLFYLQQYQDNDLAPQNFATVVDSKSKAMVAPAPDSEPIIDLPEGSEVKIIEDTGPWLYVQIPGDQLGWVHHSSVEINWPISK